MDSIGGDRKVPSARVDQTSVGPKIHLSCGSGTMKNKFCDPKNLPRQYFLGYGINNKKTQNKNMGRGIKNGGGDEKMPSYLLGGSLKMAALLKTLSRCPEKTGGAFNHAHIFRFQPSARSVCSKTHGNSKLDDKNWRGSHHLPTLCVPSKIEKWRRGCAGTHSGLMSKWTP